ncbi:MAG: nitrogen fixation protein NifZ [Magnetococcales bacterium]|nr:nitrogen fixation protein NifZ [Magnetococcales bacterium]
MIEEPKFDFGQAVRVVRTIRNDGSYSGKRTGEQLVRSGITGFVRNVGTFLQNQVIYEVHFLEQDIVVGIRESELQDAKDPWIETRFQSRDHVINEIPLSIQGQIVIPAECKGRVVKTIALDSNQIFYHVSFNGRIFQVPEATLSLDDVACEKSASGCSSCAMAEAC